LEVVWVETLEIEVPTATLRALKLGPEEMAAELRLAAAMKLYEIGRLSSGAAAELAGIPRALFLTKLADYGIDTFRQTADELRREAANA
jgi:predicted HTH domain antitoxin